MFTKRSGARSSFSYLKRVGHQIVSTVSIQEQKTIFKNPKPINLTIYSIMKHYLLLKIQPGAKKGIISIKIHIKVTK